ncbi:MAG: hypothetical protein K6G75_11350 [Lachnospiraceae bacterium]|nr:hypothetical protein [Lachnospiraceae bacterium]
MTLKIKLFTGIVFIFFIALVLSFSIRSYAVDKRNREYREAECERENEFVKEVRKNLDECGFKNAGVNLTKMYNEDREVTYKLVANHHSFEYASDDKLDSIEDMFYETGEEYLLGNMETELTFR